MALEAATYLSDLVSANPLATDVRSQGDDHLRLIKAVLLTTFPNANRAQYFSNVQALATTDFTLTAPDDSEKIFPVDATNAAVNVMLPVTGLYDGMGVSIIKADFGPNKVTVNGNGKLLNGLPTRDLTKGFQSCHFVYSTQLNAWIGQMDKVIPTGSYLDSDASSADGYVMCDGTTTIGDASSGASLAQVYTSALFQHLWNTHNNTLCPVSGGRGSNAAADFAAHKRITMPDHRGRTRFGRDNMGGTASGVLNATWYGSDPTIVGNAGGAAYVFIAQSNLPNVSLTYSGWANASGTFSGSTSSAVRSNSQSNNVDLAHGGGEHVASDLVYGGGSCSGSFSGSGASGGSTSSLSGGVAQTAMSQLPPARITNVFMAL